MRTLYFNNLQNVFKVIKLNHQMGPVDPKVCFHNIQCSLDNLNIHDTYHNFTKLQQYILSRTVKKSKMVQQAPLIPHTMY